LGQQGQYNPATIKIQGTIQIERENFKEQYYREGTANIEGPVLKRGKTGEVRTEKEEYNGGEERSTNKESFCSNILPRGGRVIK